MPVVKKFAYRNSTWYPNDEEKAEQWLAALERTGAANVRVRLGTTNASSNGAIAIGAVQTMTVGFAQEWLSWKDDLKAQADIERHERQIWWTRFAAIAASIAAASALIGWAWTIISKQH